MDDWHCKGSEKEEKCGATTSRPFRHRNCSDLSCFGLASQKSRSSLRSSRPLAVVATACSVGWRLAAVSGSATAGPFFLLGAHIPPGRGQRGRGLGAESVRTGVRKPTNGTERDGAERTGPVSAGGILLWTGFKNYQTTRWSMNYTKKCQVQHGHGERALFAIPKCSWLRVSLLFPHLDALNPIGCGTTETTPGSKPSLPRLWRDLDSLHQILHVHVRWHDWKDGFGFRVFPWLPSPSHQTPRWSLSF